MNQEHPKFHFNLGQNVDVCDSKDKWVNGEIKYIKGNEAFIHYTGWSYRYDEYLDLLSDRILPQWEPGKQIKVNNRVDAYHPTTGWIEGRIADIQYDTDKKTPLKVKIHYFNYHPKYDRWITFNDPNFMSMIGSRSKAYGIGKTRLKMKSEGMTLSQISKKLLEIKVEKMKEELEKEDFFVKNIQGDGNCLFRSISDQLYGTQQHHKEIRQLCLKYIKDQKIFFQDYVTQELDDYIKRKSQDGVWGDDVQIEALSEIYGRPIEIYSTSSKPLRTFHEDNQHQIEPLRLAYVGFCHYNSIKNRNGANRGILNSPFGEYQGIFSAGYSQNGSAHHSNLLQYRQFFSNSNAIDFALNENVEASERKEDNLNENIMEIQNKQMSQAIKESQTDRLLEQVANSEVLQLQNQLEQEHLQEELKKIEEKELQLATELSKKVKKDPQYERPYWFHDLLSQGFAEKQILFAIEINGYDPDLVQNFLLDNM